MRIRTVELYHLHLPMKERFVTSLGEETDKDVILVELTTDSGAVGFAECTASAEPLYSEESNETVWTVMSRFLIPAMWHIEANTKQDILNIGRAFQYVKGNRMAKAALEMSVWDAFANEHAISLHQLLGGTRSEIHVGISVGIQQDVQSLLRKIDACLEKGYQRIKVKVKPGWDVNVLREVRKTFGPIPLMADANSAYRLKDVDLLRAFDEFELMMIEQPLAHDDIVDHAELQRTLDTPICLDESIHTADDARKAIALGACKIINLKLGRVGGFSEAIEIHRICTEHGIPMWCGGMLETGIGRLHNVAITSLPGFTLPGDTAPSARYFGEDLISPEVEFIRPGVLCVESLNGVAERVQRERILKWTKRRQEWHNPYVSQNIIV